MLLHISLSPLQLGWVYVFDLDQWALRRNDMCHFSTAFASFLSPLPQYHWKPHKTVGGNGIPNSLDVGELPLTCLWVRLWVSEKITFVLLSH